MAVRPESDLQRRFLSGKIIIPYTPDTLSAPSYSEQEQECCVRKTADETVTQSKEFITLMASYRFPSFRALAKMFYEKSGNQQYDTKRRICYTDDILPPSSSR